MITTVFFDLDGTLLPMDLDEFQRAYMGGLAKKIAPHGYDPKVLLKGISLGIVAMVGNTGHRTNEEVFWEAFSGCCGRDGQLDTPIFMDYYHNEFQQLKALCGFESAAAETVAELKDRGLRLVLATNPLFPAIATQSRAKWAGLEPNDFEIVTTYENSCRCKPNPDYYRELLGKLGLKAEECLMVGNDADEDMVAEEVGMQVFLLTPCLINRHGKDISQWPNGGFGELMDYIRSL